MPEKENLFLLVASFNGKGAANLITDRTRGRGMKEEKVVVVVSNEEKQIGTNDEDSNANFTIARTTIQYLHGKCSISKFQMPTTQNFCYYQ